MWATSSSLTWGFSNNCDLFYLGTSGYTLDSNTFHTTFKKPHFKNINSEIDELQEKVWSYQSHIETHTVETHIYRLRKKILNTFNDNEFIISKKNGYQIN